MTSFNYQSLTRNFILIVFYFLLATHHAAYSMDKENIDESNLGKREKSSEFLVPEIPAKYAKQEAGPASPAPVSPRPVPISPRIESLTSPFSKVGLASPVGLKTPKKYIDTTPTPKILELFVTNFLHYEKQSPLAPLITFLFVLDDKGKLQRNNSVIDSQRDPFFLFPKFLWAEINEELFNGIFESYENYCTLRDFHLELRACKTAAGKEELKNKIVAEITNQQLLQEMLNAFGKKFQKINSESAAKKEFLNQIDGILEAKYRFKNCGNFCDQKLDQKRCKTCALFKFSTNQKKWLDTLLAYLIELNTEADKELCSRYQKIAYYLVGFYLCEWSSGNQPSQPKKVNRKLNFDSQEEICCDQNSNVSSTNKPFDLITAAQECLTHYALGSNFHHVLPTGGTQIKQSNSKLIEQCIEASPLYYLLCFNIHHQEINERIENICNGRYEPANTPQNTSVLDELVRDLIDEYKDCLHVASCFSEADASLLTKIECARNILVQTFNHIIQHLAQMHHANVESQLVEQADLNLYSYEFKELIVIALMIRNALSLDESSFDNNVITVKKEHIEQIVYELHQRNQKYDLGGGHMDCELPYSINIGPDEHSVRESYNLAFNTSSGVSFRDWFVYNQFGAYTSHKSATVFPSCFTTNFWSTYVLKLLAHNTTDQNVHCYDSGKRVIEQDGSWKRMVVFQHQHSVGCDKTCSFDPNSTMYITAIIREELIDKTGSPDDEKNLIRSVISLYPLSVYCLHYDNNCLFLNEEALQSDEDLAHLIPDYYDYKRMPNADQGLIYDQTGKPLYEKAPLSYETIYTALHQAKEKLSGKQKNKKTIAGNIDSSLIEITNPTTQQEYVLVKVAQGIVIKILKTDLLSLA